LNSCEQAKNSFSGMRIRKRFGAVSLISSKKRAFTKIEDAVFSAHKAGDPIEYQPASTKQVRETEAEAVAFIVCQAIGLATTRTMTFCIGRTFVLLVGAVLLAFMASPAPPNWFLSHSQRRTCRTLVLCRTTPGGPIYPDELGVKYAH
jgi:hypothetical protein